MIQQVHIEFFLGLVHGSFWEDASKQVSCLRFLTKICDYDVGERTFGVLTKLDLMDKGTNALDVLYLPPSFICENLFLFYYYELISRILFVVKMQIFCIPHYVSELLFSFFWKFLSFLLLCINVALIFVVKMQIFSIPHYVSKLLFFFCKVLEGRALRLQQPWVGIVNRSQADINKNTDMMSARRREREYFATSPDYGHLASKMGSEYLAKLLSMVNLYFN